MGLLCVLIFVIIRVIAVEFRHNRDYHDRDLKNRSLYYVPIYIIHRIGIKLIQLP